MLLTEDGDGVTAIDEGGGGVEVLRRARDGCVDGEELGARRGGGGETKEMEVVVGDI